MTKRLTTKEFIERSQTAHGDRYDYSLAEYKNYGTKVTIICSEHGAFDQNPYNHFASGNGCPQCGRRIVEQAVSKKTRAGINEFVARSNLVHSGKYDYSKVKYETCQSKVIIICPEHGEFKQVPNNHWRGAGCQKCARKNSGLNQALGIDEFVRKADDIFNSKYNYEFAYYKNMATHVAIECPVHGLFKQTPANHLYHELGCPNCSDHGSKGEKRIQEILDKYKIEYTRFKKFNGCRHKGILEFDFYLPDYHMLIEYDGIQHSIVNEWFGGQTEFDDMQIRDEIKNKFAIENNYTLIRIPYTELDGIERIILEFVNN